MTAIEIVTEIRKRGGRVDAVQGKLVVSPVGVLDDSLRTLIRNRKSEIISLLTEGVDSLVPGELGLMAAETYRRICSGHPDVHGALQRLRVDRPDLVKSIARAEADADAVGRDFYAGRATRDAIRAALEAVQEAYRQAVDALRHQE